MLVGEMGGEHEGLLGLRRIPQEAFHIGNRRAADLLLADIGGGQLVAGAEIGVHGPLAMRRHQDHRAGCRRPVSQPLHLVVDAQASEVGFEDVAQIVGCDLADKSGATAERGNARCGIGGAAAGDAALIGWHAVVEGGRAFRVDEMHDALGQPFAFEKAFLDRRDHIDDGIADGQNVKTGIGQGNVSYSGVERGLADRRR